MPDDDSTFHLSANQIFGPGEKNIFLFNIGSLSEEKFAQLLTQIQAALDQAYPRTDYEALRNRIDQLERQLREARARRVVGDDAATGNRIVVEMPTEDWEALRRIVPLLQRSEIGTTAYAFVHSAEPDLSPDDYLALARRLVAKQKYGDPIEQARREESQYIPLKMKFIRHSRASSEEPFRPDRDFEDILSAVEAARAGPGSDPFPALVLLGAPGGGKSTALRHLAWVRLSRSLASSGERLPLIVNLGEYRNDAPNLARLRRACHDPDLELSPVNFMRAHWYYWLGYDGFEQALDDGRLWLILDGLNEIPDRVNRIPDWIGFFDRRFPPANRAVIACRRADYGEWLDLPRLEIEPLDDRHIQEFLNGRLGLDAGGVVMHRLAGDAKLLEVVRNPFWLNLLAEYAKASGSHLPDGRAALIDWFVKRWLLYGHGRADLPALSADDVDALKEALEPFAYWLLGEGDNPPKPWKDACVHCGVWHGHSDQGDALRRAEAASLVVSRSSDPKEVHFYHQLLLEYFAGRDLARRFQAKEPLADRWRFPWSAGWRFELKEWKRLPPPPPTRWEETSVFAAARPGTPIDEFVRAVLTENPPLAARCLLEAGLEAGKEVPDELRQAVIDRLLALVERRDPMLDSIPESSARLSLRIAAGHALGKLGDSRILKGQGHATLDGKEIMFIQPDWCPVQAGPFTMGSHSWYKQEQSEHVCDVIQAGYKIGKFPVTNAEFECFVQAKGYETKRYWTPQGWAWQHQDIATAQPPAWLFWRRDRVREMLDEIQQWPDRGTASPSQVGFYKSEAERTDEELIAWWRRREVSLGRSRNPWRDDRDLNGRNQPVVGVCWYEAMAYCAWLTDALRAAGRIKENEIVTLPNEPEWEKAALPPLLPGEGPGGEVGIFPWGDDSTQAPLHDRANTLNGRVLTTTPIGVYDNASACGALDMSGNVWEWTRSRWGDDPGKPAFGYPYSDDLDERERLDADDLRIVRGGSWHFEASNARCAYRNRNTPDNRDGVSGFRCVLRSP